MQNRQKWHCTCAVENVADFNAFKISLDECIIENREMSHFSCIHMVFRTNVI